MSLTLNEWVLKMTAKSTFIRNEGGRAVGYCVHTMMAMFKCLPMEKTVLSATDRRKSRRESRTSSRMTQMGRLSMNSLELRSCACFENLPSPAQLVPPLTLDAHDGFLVLNNHL